MKQDEKELCGWFIFCPKQQLLLVKDGDRFHIPYSVEPPVQLPADTPYTLENSIPASKKASNTPAVYTPRIPPPSKINPALYIIDLAFYFAFSLLSFYIEHSITRFR